MRGREFPSASWQILSWITMEYYAMLLSMNEGRPCHQSVNKRVKWLGALAVLLFLLEMCIRDSLNWAFGTGALLNLLAIVYFYRISLDHYRKNKLGVDSD